LVVAVSAAMLLAFAAACGDDPEPAPAPAPAGITAADLQAAMASIQIPEGLSEDDVSRIVEGAAQPGLSAAEVSKIVSDQLDAQPGISAADLQKAVDTAVMEAGGITAADLQSAVAGIQIPTGLSEAEVSKIVSDQLAAQPGITAVELQKAVDTAVMEAGGITAADLQSAIAGIQIPEGLSEADVTKIVEGAAQPGISAAEVSKIVSDQLDAQPGISDCRGRGPARSICRRGQQDCLRPAAADLQKAVDTAVMEAGGITAADLQSAIAGIEIPEGLSEADVTRIVEGAAQPGLSAAEVSKIVSDQLDAQPGITAMELQKAVDEAVMAAAGITAEDLQAAIGGIQIPEGLTQDDVSMIVEGAMQPGLSADEVSKIVSDQLDAQPGITAMDLQKAVDAAVVLAVAAAVPATPAPADVMQYGTLDVGFREVVTFGNDHTVRTTPETGIASTIASEPMLRLDRNGQVVPGVISDWSLDDSSTVWTFKVQQGVEFHRGWGNLTSDDIIFTQQEIGGEDSIDSAASLSRGYFAAEGGGTTKVDDYTFTVDLVNPQRGLLDYLIQPAFVLSKSAYDSLGREVAGPLGIGTGPWLFEEDSHHEYWRFSALQDHWRKAPEFAELVFWQIPEENTRLAGFLTGNLDTFLMNFDSKPSLDKVPGIQYMAIPNGTSAHLGLHPNHYVGMGEADFEERRPGAFNCLKDDACPWVSPNPDINSPEWERARKVREAMLISVDRQAIVDSFLDGEGLPQSLWTWENALHRLPPKYREWEFNPDRARQLLAEAGYEDGFDMIVTASTRGVAGEHASCEAVAEYFEDIGIRTQIDRVPQTVIGPKLNARSYVGLNCHGTGGRASPATIMYILYGSESGFSGGFDHPIMDQLMDEMNAAVDEEVHWATLIEIAAFIYDNAMDSGLYTVNLLFPLGPGVVEWSEHINYAESRALGAYEYAKHRAE
jgi:peptide/nickel transport system substrate-binding protein